MDTASNPKCRCSPEHDSNDQALPNDDFLGTVRGKDSGKPNRVKDLMPTAEHVKDADHGNGRPLHAAVVKGESKAETTLDTSRQSKESVQDNVDVVELKEECFCMPTRQSSVQQQPKPGRFVGANRAAGTPYTETNERLEQFIGYFVKEFEAKLRSYHLILEGEFEKSGKFSDKFSGKIGQGVGGAIGGIVGLFFGLPAGGASVLAKTGKVAGEKLGSTLGKKRHANKVISLSDLINSSQKDKGNFRKVLVEAGFDIFQSFEMQFMRVSTDKGPKDALHKLAKDAVDRAINYLKNKNDAFISEGVISGESKKQAVHSVSPGFQIKYEYQLSSKTWSTANLYHKAGLLVIQKNKPCFYKKKHSTGGTGKYGYRRLFAWESWDRMREKFDLDNIAESKSGQFTDYEYIFYLENMEVKCKNVLEKINLDDKSLTEDRIKEVLEEVKCDILEEVNVLKEQSHGHTEDREVLANIEANLQNFKPEDYLQIVRQYFEDASQQRQKIAIDNKEEHGITQAGVGKLSEGIKNVQKYQEESKEILEKSKQTTERIEKYQLEAKQIAGETGSNVKQMKKDIETLLCRQQTKEKCRVWFDMREPIKPFAGRQEQLYQIVNYEQQGMVVVTGLSGVGKTELAVQYAHTEYSQDSSAVWINAENRETIKRSFHRLYKRLGFRIKDADGEEKDIKSIAEDVYDHFSDRKSLFIFDNAEKYGTIKDLLPLGLPGNVNKPYVLITSNNLEVVDVKTLPLGDFTIDESVHFVQKSLNIRGESQNNEIQELAKKLHNFPLALQQAVAYITEENRRLKNVNPEKEFTIKDYLKEYERKAEELLKYEVFRKISSDYDKTTFTAIQITLNKIRNQKYAQQALDILNVMSYFAPENIPAKAFLEIVSDERELGSVIQLLKEYSLIRHEGLLSMHGLVQQVIRLELEKQKEEERIMEEKCLNIALKLLKEYMIDYKTIEGYVPHIISVWNHANKYDALIEAFIVRDIDDKETHATYFHIIAVGNPYEVVKHILSRIEENYPNELTNVINQDSNSRVTPLHNAALSGDERTVRLLVDKGANVNVETKHKWSPLHFAAKNGYLESVKTLLDRGANFNAESEYKFTPLHVAAKGGYIRIVDVLLDKGASVNSKTNRGFTALHFAVDNGRINIVSTLLAKGADVKAKTRHEYTPLHLAAKGGHPEIFDALMAGGADTEPRTRLKFTPLHFAAQNGHLTIVQALLSRGVNVDAKDANRFTPLHLAALNGHTDIANALLHRNAAINAKTTRGNTPLHLAAEKGHFLVVKADYTKSKS